MDRDMVIKMPGTYNITDSQSSQTKITDSKGKKNSNSKICVYHFLDAAIHRNISLIISINHT
jgi:hypothetical protein